MGFHGSGCSYLVGGCVMIGEVGGFVVGLWWVISLTPID